MQLLPHQRGACHARNQRLFLVTLVPLVPLVLLTIRADRASHAQYCLRKHEDYSFPYYHRHWRWERSIQYSSTLWLWSMMKYYTSIQYEYSTCTLRILDWTGRTHEHTDAMTLSYGLLVDDVWHALTWVQMTRTYSFKGLQGTHTHIFFVSAYTVRTRAKNVKSTHDPIAPLASSFHFASLHHRTGHKHSNRLHAPSDHRKNVLTCQL